MPDLDNIVMMVDELTWYHTDGRNSEALGEKAVHNGFIINITHSILG
jgi:hypothetical protein